MRRNDYLGASGQTSDFAIRPSDLDSPALAIVFSDHDFFYKWAKIVAI